MVDAPKVKESRQEKKAVQSEEKQLTQNVAAFIKVTFDLMASVAGTHWQLSVEEAKSIAEPAGRIMNRLDLAESTNQYADYFMLGLTLAVAVVPRALVSIELAKKRREVKKYQHSQRETREDKPQAVGESSVNVDSGLKRTMPALAF